MTGEQARKIPALARESVPSGLAEGATGTGRGARHRPAGGAPRPSRADGAAHSELAGTTAFSLARKATWVPADGAKASACFRARDGRTTNSRTPTLPAHPAQAPAPVPPIGTFPRMHATGSAHARAALRPAPTSALPDRFRPGSCLARRLPTTRASSCGTTPGCSSRTTRTLLSGLGPLSEKGGRSNSSRRLLQSKPKSARLM